MKVFDIIFEQGEYKIKFKGCEHVGGLISPENINAARIFKFALIKNDKAIQFYSIALPYPTAEQPDYDKIKSEVIIAFKTKIV